MVGRESARPSSRDFTLLLGCMPSERSVLDMLGWDQKGVAALLHKTCMEPRANSPCRGCTLVWCEVKLQTYASGVKPRPAACTAASAESRKQLRSETSSNLRRQNFHRSQ